MIRLTLYIPFYLYIQTEKILPGTLRHVHQEKRVTPTPLAPMHRHIHLSPTFKPSWIPSACKLRLWTQSSSQNILGNNKAELGEQTQ
jgi:hypothetical protein